MNISEIPTHSATSSLVSIVESHLKEFPLQRQAKYPSDFQAVLSAAEELSGVECIVTDDDVLSLHIGPVLIERVDKEEYQIALRLTPEICKVVQVGLCQDLTIDFINHYPFEK